MSRVALACVLALLASASMRRAHAETLVVVVPFSGDDDLAIYGKPIADEVAGALRKAGVQAEVIIGDLTRGDVVVALRASRQGKLVRLEASVRPVVGEEVLAQGASRPVRVEKLGQAAVQLARGLAPKLPAAAEQAMAQRASAAAPPEPSQRGGAVPATAPAPLPSRPFPVDARPPLVIAAPDGHVAGVGVVRVGLAPLRGVAERAGFRVVAAGFTGMVDPAAAAEAARTGGARATVMVAVLAVEIGRGEVVHGRGRVQVVAVGQDRSIRFNRTVRTDTVVGSRSDRPDAIVGYIVRQAMEIVGRELAQAVR
jgi:hypothetical protein